MQYLNNLAQLCFRQSAMRGFWDSERNKGEMLCLIHSEVSEVLEAVRKGEPQSEKIPPFSLEEEELADILIRVLDYAGGFGLDIDGAVKAKMQFNESRPYKHGKLF